MLTICNAYSLIYTLLHWWVREIFLQNFYWWTKSKVMQVLYVRWFYLQINLSIWRMIFACTYILSIKLMPDITNTLNTYIMIIEGKKIHTTKIYSKWAGINVENRIMELWMCILLYDYMCACEYVCSIYYYRYRLLHVCGMHEKRYNVWRTKVKKMVILYKKKHRVMSNIFV